MVIIVTGFGVFKNYKVNPSWEAVKILGETWDDPENKIFTEQIPVEYDFVLNNVPNKWNDKNPEFVIHVGVSCMADKITLERQGHNIGYDKKDTLGTCPPDQCCVPSRGDIVETTCLDLEKLMMDVNNDKSLAEMEVEACVSDDAGRYLCDFVYFKSLHSFSGKSLFVHVPEENKPYTIQQTAEGLRCVIKNVILQLKAQVD